MLLNRVIRQVHQFVVNLINFIFLDTGANVAFFKDVALKAFRLLVRSEQREHSDVEFPFLNQVRMSHISLQDKCGVRLFLDTFSPYMFEDLLERPKYLYAISSVSRFSWLINPDLSFLKSFDKPQELIMLVEVLLQRDDKGLGHVVVRLFADASVEMGHVEVQVRLLIHLLDSMDVVVDLVSANVFQNAPLPYLGPNYMSSLWPCSSPSGLRIDIVPGEPVPLF